MYIYALDICDEIGLLRIKHFRVFCVIYDIIPRYDQYVYILYDILYLSSHHILASVQFILASRSCPYSHNCADRR